MPFFVLCDLSLYLLTSSRHLFFFTSSNILVKYDALALLRTDVTSFLAILYFDHSSGHLVSNAALKILYLLLILKRISFVIQGSDLLLILTSFYGTCLSQTLLNKVCHAHRTSFGSSNIVATWKGADSMSCLKFSTFSFL